MHQRLQLNLFRQYQKASMLAVLIIFDSEFKKRLYFTNLKHSQPNRTLHIRALLRFVFLVSAGFRSPPFSGRRRMASYMWFRCIVGPHLQRIHRPPDQSLPEGRSGRRVGADRLF